MPGRRGSRFALEVFFLVALAVGLAVAEERPLVIAGVMALGWLLVALAEWALWREEPHYASGLPPRWYVPRVNLPPAQPLDPVVSGYPEGRRDEAPTWIATPALRSEMLGEWPHAAAVTGEPAGEDGIVEGTVVEGSIVDAGIVEADPVENRAVEVSAVEADAWTIVELPPSPLQAPEPVPPPVADVQPEPEPEPAPEPEPEAAGERTEEPEPEPDVPDLDPPPAADADLAVELTRSAGGTARYSLDPFAEAPRRRFGRRGDEPPTIPVPARPEGVRLLPDALERDE